MLAAHGHIVLHLKFKFVIRQIKIRRNAAEKSGICVLQALRIETWKRCNFSSSRNCKSTEILPERERARQVLVVLDVDDHDLYASIEGL